MIANLFRLITRCFRGKQRLDSVELSRKLADMANTFFKPKIDNILTEFVSNRNYNEEVLLFGHFTTVRALHLSTLDLDDKQKLGAMMTGYFALILQGNGEIMHPLPAPADMESTRKKLLQSFEEYLTDPKSQGPPGTGYTNAFLKRLGITDPALLVDVTILMQQHISATTEALNNIDKNFNLSYT